MNEAEFHVLEKAAAGSRLAENLNADCHCHSLDRGRLAEELERVSPGFHGEVMAGRPHLFSDTVAFVGADHVERMASLVAAIDSVVALPAYRERVMAWAPSSARHRPGARGVFLGYDFHVAPDVPEMPGAATGPQLIEINTNAGGGLLNALLAKAQQSCCEQVATHLPGELDADTPEHLFLEMFRTEWQRARGTVAPLKMIAIVDQAPETQYLYPEFVLFRRLFESAGINAVICAPEDLAFRDGALWHGGQRVDLVYNRLTDFALENGAHVALRDAYLTDAAVITPHPHAHALYADKRNLAVLSDDDLLQQWGIDEHTRRVLREGIPRTEIVTSNRSEEFWSRRRQLFFKPAAGYGSKAAYRGDKLTTRVFAEIISGLPGTPYVAQALVPPSLRTLRLADPSAAAPIDLKLDLRNYAYDGHVQLIAARLWQGQATNFRTPGGGFASVLQVSNRLASGNVA